MLNVSPGHQLIHFGDTLVLGFDETQSMAVIGDVWHPQDQKSLFFFFNRNKSQLGVIIKIRKNYLNSEVVENLSCIL